MSAKDDTPPSPNRKQVFDGTRGVYFDPVPAATPDGAWRRLVNAEFAETSPRTKGRAQGGMRKRGGIAAVSANLGGQIMASAGVPLPSELDFSAQLLVAMNTAAGAGSAWKSSTDGAVFTDVAATVLPRCYQNRAWAGVNFDEEKPPRASLYRRNLYYPSQNYAEANPPNDPPPLAMYAANSQGYDVLDIPKNTAITQEAYAITDTLGINGLIYLSIFDQSGRARVLRFDPRLGALTIVGAEFTTPSGSAMCLAWYLGRLWVGTYALPGTAKGYIYSIEPNTESTWTLDRTSADNNGGYHQLVQYGDNLYACTDADAIGTALIEQRTPAGVWSTSFTAAAAGTSRFSGAIVFDGKLFVGWYKWSATTQALIKVYNGTVWTTDKDIKADYALKAPGQPIIFASELYWPVFDAADSISATNFLMKRTAGAGTWSRPLTGVALQGTAAIRYPTA